MFTTTETFYPHMPSKFERILLSKTNGGSILVEALLDEATNEWVTTDTISSDGATQLVFGNVVVRVTPSGGAVYNVL
jgi:hypothetical protein